LDDSFQSTDHSMKYPNIYIGFLLLLIFSCEDKPPQQTENAIPTPEVITKEIVAKYQDCQVDSLSCTYARIAYPQFTDSSMQKLNEAIADKVHDHAANFMMEDSAHEDLNAVANAFVDDYARFVQEFTDYKLGWYLKISAEVIYESIEFISLMIDIETFTGGAHPNATTNYYVFNTKTSQALSLSDIISDTTQFKQILKGNFREQKGIDDSISLAEAGYNIYDDEFVMNENIAITEDQVIVHFNPYEIAPYSMGPTTVKIDKNELQSIMKIN
jgi:hypothetical protein